MEVWSKRKRKQGWASDVGWDTPGLIAQRVMIYEGFGFVIVGGCNIRIKVWDPQHFFSDVQSFLKRWYKLISYLNWIIFITIIWRWQIQTLHKYCIAQWAKTRKKTISNMCLGGCTSKTKINVFGNFFEWRFPKEIRSEEIFSKNIDFSLWGATTQTHVRNWFFFAF